MKTLTIEFDEFPDEHVELIISPVAMGDLLDVIGRMSSVEMTREAVGELMALVAPYVASWTYPEPLGLEGLMARDFGWIISVVDAWVDGVRDVPRPLPRASSAGTPSKVK